MQRAPREIKYAAWGFLGGFVLCYLLIAAFQPQPVTSSPITRPPSPIMLAPTLAPQASAMTNHEAFFPAPSPIVVVTNVQLPDVRVELLEPLWQSYPDLLQMRPRTRYSLDLIDTHNRPPSEP